MQTVNDRDDISRWGTCWICDHPTDHRNPMDSEVIPHGAATGDGLTRFDIIDYLDGRNFRPEVMR